MTFLNPAVLIGLAAASIPVLIHLLNLRKLKKIEFSTLNFLKELQKNKIRRVRLKQWLLLALRVMIILLIVTAFARPTLEGVSIGGTTSAAKTTAVFILDDTFSMSVVAQNGSYFNQAKQTIKNLLAQLEDGDEAGLILISGEPDDELQLTTNRHSFIDHLDEVKISSGSRTLNSALIEAAELISKSKNFNKEIYLLTDFQKSRIATEQNITDLGQILNDQIRLYSFNFSQNAVNNISIDNLKVVTKIFEKDKPIRFEATITNYSNQAVANLVVSQFLGGKRYAQRSIDLNTSETKIVQLEAVAQQTGYIDAVVEIEDDDINEDNKRYASVYIPEKISLLLLYENLSDTRFIKLALKSAVDAGNINLTEYPVSRINSLQLNGYDLILIVGNDLKTGPDDLMNYLTNGGGLILFPSSVPNLQKFLQVTKSLKLPPITAIIKASDNSNSYVEFEKVDFNHPVFSDIFRDKEKKEIESPRIDNYYKMTSIGEGKRIISLIDGSTFLSEYSLGKGKVFLFNVSPVLEWSDFPLKSIFTALLYKSAFYLSANDRSESEYIAGEPLNINISKRTLPQIKIGKPDQSEDLKNLNGNDSEFLSFNRTFITGIYKIYSGGKLLEEISVNADPLESNVTYISDNDFDEFLDKINFKGTHVQISRGDDPVSLVLQARFGSELWRYFLIAAFVLALIEMMIARSAKKELVEIKE